MTAFEVNYTQYFTRGEWFWRLGQAGITDNTMRLFDQEEIDGEAFGMMMMDNEETWLEDTLGEESSDLVTLTNMWNQEKNAALRLLDGALRDARLNAQRPVRATLNEVARRLNTEFEAEADPAPAVVTDSEPETEGDESDDDTAHSAGWATFD